MTVRRVAVGTRGPDVGQTLRIPLAFGLASIAAELRDLERELRPHHASMTVAHRRAENIRALLKALEAHCESEGNGDA